MLSLASPDAWHVSGRTCTVVQRPCSHRRRSARPSFGRPSRRPPERRFAVRASTGSPAARRADSWAAPITPSPSLTGHPRRRGLGARADLGGRRAIYGLPTRCV